MARLQILQLPEGAGDGRPPFVLVIDQASENTTESLPCVGASTAELLGARTVLIFRETVEIPANEPPPVADDPERAGATEIVYAHERTRLDLCSALLVSGDTTWRKLIEHVTERQRELAGLYRQNDALAARLQQVQTAPTKPDLMNAQQERPDIWRHGYECGVLAAKSAARPRDERAQGIKDRDSTGRPTHPDGSPYRYHEIKAGGWQHCDGCHTWGQWTAREPHECPESFSSGPAAPTPRG